MRSPRAIAAALVLLAVAGCVALLRMEDPNAAGDALTIEGRLSEAASAYERAARGGELRAQNNLAVVRYVDARWSADVDRTKRRALRAEARAAFSDLSEQGFAPASTNLALLNYRAKRDTPAYERAKAAFELAIEQGDADARLGLAFHLARLFRHPDNRKRQRLLKTLADEGDATAAGEWGETLIALGRDAEAERYLLQAAEAGNHKAQAELAFRFPDREDAAMWLTRVQEAGDPRGPYRLARRRLLAAQAASRCIEDAGEAAELKQIDRWTAATRADACGPVDFDAVDAALRTTIDLEEARLARRRGAAARRREAVQRIDVRPDGLRLFVIEDRSTMALVAESVVGIQERADEARAVHAARMARFEAATAEP
ncbi:MAG: hypothetical protein AAFX03_00550 [Pseudomonadota bacterium]